jgi:hypothetical protein
MANRVQVEDLAWGNQVQPTAQVVDTYTRPETPVQDDTLQRLADAVGRLVPGIATQQGEKEKKEQQAMAEKEFMREQASGYKLTRDNIMSGNEYLQDSAIALKHLQTLRAKAFMDNNLSEYKNDLFNNKMGVFGSRADVNADMSKYLGELTQSIGSEDEFIWSAVAPQIAEFKHNTLASWDKKYNDNLIAERENLYQTGITNIFKNAGGKSEVQVVNELMMHVDSHYRLGNKKATETFVDSVIALADSINDPNIIDIALKVRPGGRDLTPSQIDKLIDGADAVEAEIQAKASHTLKVQKAQEEKTRDAAKAKTYDLLQDPNMTSDSPEVRQQIDLYAANGGDPIAFEKSVRGLIEARYKDVTPAQNENFNTLKYELQKAAASPNRMTSMNKTLDGLLDKINVHPTQIPKLREWANTLDATNNYLSSADVKTARNSFVNMNVDSSLDFSDALTNQKKDQFSSQFNTRLMANLAEAHAQAGGLLTDSAVRAVAETTKQQLMQELAEEAKVQANTSQQIKDAKAASLKFYNDSATGLDSLIDDNEDDIEIPESHSLYTKEQRQEVLDFYTKVKTDPFAEIDTGTLKGPAWKVFDQVYGPGAFLGYSKKYK